MARSGLKGTYAAPAIEKAFEIFELLATRPEGALITEMAADLNSIGMDGDVKHGGAPFSLA